MVTGRYGTGEVAESYILIHKQGSRGGDREEKRGKRERRREKRERLSALGF